MVVRLRLARHGTRNNPFYHLVAIQDKAAREARPIEKLGEYDPIPRPRPTSSGDSAGPRASTASTSQRILTSGLENHKVVLEKRVEWNAGRIKYWLGVGAQPSKPVARLLDRAGLIPDGKFFKGMYRAPVPPSSSATASPSAILHAATGLATDSLGSSSLAGTGAATALRQEETVEGAEKTDPAREAAKAGMGEATIDQAG